MSIGGHRWVLVCIGGHSLVGAKKSTKIDILAKKVLIFADCFVRINRRAYPLIRYPRVEVAYESCFNENASKI